LDLVVAPPDAVQGQAQRLMYVHVPSAWLAYACFAAVFVASIGVLLRRGPRWDACARAAAELGVGMVALTIAEGSLWGHVVWGAWWTWDPRLVTTSLLLILYLVYLAVRGLPMAEARAAKAAAVVGVVSFAMVPVVHFSVLWWRALHQPPTLLSPSTSPPINGMMFVALLVSLLAYSLVGLWWIRRRVSQLLAPPASESAAVVPVAEPAVVGPRDVPPLEPAERRDAESIAGGRY
jgi:heme exporter protein C